MDVTDVAVIGAGVAGLTCARALDRRGFEVRVLEQADRVGGRTGSEVVDGFRCDVGLSWFDAAHPVLRNAFDVAALNPRPLDRGLVLAHPEGYRVLQGSHAALVAAIRAGLGQPQDIARLLRWSDPMRRPVERMSTGRDMTLGESLERHGIAGRMREELLRPAFRMLFGDEDLGTSYQFAMLVLRQLRDGSPALPALGMQSLPNQLALMLSTPPQLGVQVHEVKRDDGEGVRLRTDAGELRARVVVVATEAAAASGLLGLGAPMMRGVATWWFAMPEPPTTLKTAFLNPLGPAGGPISHALVVSNVAPRYAPPDRALLGASSVPLPGAVPGAESEDDVRRQLGQLFRASTDAWQLVTRQVAPEAWPVARPPLISRRDVELGDGVYVAGDHRELPGIAGAAASGLRVAQAVREELLGPTSRAE